MLQIGKSVISLDVIQKEFCCDIEKCKGACCVDGDSGAPLTPEEATIIETLYPDFEDYLSEENKAEIEKQGFSVTDSDGDLVTPIVGNNECVFTFTDERGITKCAIERAYFDKKTSFRKPVSCHLFPIRITVYKRFEAVNYQQLDICQSGRICGKIQGLPLWKYLAEPLTRQYGSEWYEELKYAAENLPEELTD